MFKNTWFILLFLIPSAPTALHGQLPNAVPSLPDAPSYASRADMADSAGAPISSAPVAPAIIRTETPKTPRFAWRAAARQSMTLLVFQHGARMAQRKTREQMGGPFFRDYTASIGSIHGWRDGDGVLTNYLAHPMMGAVTGYVQVQNDRAGIYQEFSNSRQYWESRLRAMAFAAAYSTQFEIGPFSEAALGNVGMKKGTSGWVDFIMTPTGGFSLMLAEDVLDRYLISRWEAKSSPPHKRVYRVLLNPCRSIANLARYKVPWHRDSRQMLPQPSEPEESPSGTAGAN